jgi:hypothetical protein
VVTSCMIPEITPAVADRASLFDVSGERLVAHLHSFDASHDYGASPGCDVVGSRQPRPGLWHW